jgi:heptosyltransferase-2
LLRVTRSKGRILVIRGGAIGDFVLTLPVLQALRAAFPEAHLEMLGYPHIAALAGAGGLVDQVRALDQRGLAGFFATGHQPAGELAAYFSGFDIILSFLYDPDGIFAANLGKCSRAQFIVGPHRPDETSEVHATEVFLKPLERLALFHPDPVPRLRVEQTGPLVTRTAGSAICRTLAAHPGSGSERKNWPEAKWAILLERLAGETDLNVLLVGGEAEAGRLARLQGALPASRCRVLQNQPLVQVAAELQQCTVFLGHDSGITHLAAAVGLPGLALWAESKEAIWRPRSLRFTVVRGRTELSDLPVERVFEEVMARLADG